MAPLHTEEQLSFADDDLIAEDEELSDEQIQALLKKAEARLRERASSAAKDVSTLPKFPRLNVGEIAQPYVRTNGDVARVDPSKLLGKRERDLANKIRKVEDPVAVKQRLSEVCFDVPSACLPMRKIFPFSFLSRLGSRFGHLPAPLRAILHSYSEANFNSSTCHILFETGY